MADFDVSLRLGIQYRSDDAKRAEQDLIQIRRAAERMGGQAAGASLDRDIRDLSRTAGVAGRDLRSLSREADRLGAVRAGDRLSRDIIDVGSSARRSERGVDALRQASERLGSSRGIGADALRNDIAEIGRQASLGETKIDDVRDAVRRLGREDGARDLATDLERAERAASRLGRRSASRGTNDTPGSAGAGSSGTGTGAGAGGGYGAGGRNDDQRLRRDLRDEREEGAGDRRQRNGRDAAEEFADRIGLGAVVPIGGSAAMMGGAVAGGAALGVGYLGYRAGGEAMQLETAMAEVKRQVDGLDDTGIVRLRNGIVRLSEDTGIAKEQIAALVANAAKANTAAADLLPFASYASKFAVAADMQQGEAGQTLALLKSQFNISQARVPEVLDVVNYLADRSATSESGILQFMGRAAPAANIAGLSPEKLAAFGTGFLNVGTQPEVAGTGFNALAMRLGTASQTARTDKDFRRSLGRLGLNGRELQSDFYQDSSAAILDVFERVSALPKEQQLEILKGLGGQEYGDDFAKITGQTNAIRGFLTDAQSPTAKGSVEATFAASNDTTARDLARAGASLASLGAELGETFLPAVRIFAQAVSRFAGGWAESIRQERIKDEIVRKQIAGEPLTATETGEYNADKELKDRVDSEVRDRRQGIERNRRQAQDYELRNMDDPEAQERAAGRALAERNRADTLSEIEESRRVLGVLSPEQPGYRDTERKLEVLEERLKEIDETLQQGFGEMKASPIGFLGGGSEARLWNASLGPRGGGMFAGAYDSGVPTMDGMAGSWRGGGSGGGAGGGGAGVGGAPFGSGSGKAMNATTNPGGAAGEIYDVLSTSFSDPQSFALLGHIQKESSLDPNAWNAGEQAGGLLQWRGNRLANLKAFAQSKGMDWRDRKVQAAFISHEMQTDPYERQRSAKFRSAGTVEEASAALEDYVRFGDGSGGERLSNARGFAQSFGAQPASAAAYGGGSGGTEVGEDLLAKHGIARGRANLFSGGRRQGAVGEDLVEIRTPGGEKWNVRRDAAPAFQGFLTELEASGYPLYSSGGVNPRKKRGGNSWSEHAFGNAVDVNSRENPFKHGLTTDLPPDISDRAARWGLTWGGDWKGKKDPMHFEWSGIPAEEIMANKQGAVAPPVHARTGALPDPKEIAEGAEAITGPLGAAGEFGDDGWTTDPARRPKQAASRAGARDAARPGAGAGPGRSPSGPVSQPLNQHFHGVDPQIMAARAARSQRREIRAAEARAMHDTAVPVS